MNNPSTKQLFEQLKSKIVLKLSDNQQPCTTCNGLRMNYVERDNSTFIENCTQCYNGALHKCKYCGRLNKTNFCHCKEAVHERGEIQRKKEYDKFQEALKTAKIIPIKEYDGWLTSVYNDERVVEADDYIEEYLDNFDTESSPKFVCASVGEDAFTLDIKDIISDKTESGYDDMYDRLDMNSPLLSEVQVLLNKWVDENKSAMKVYHETNKIIVDLTELYEEGVRNGKM